jgi:hypothetical protein
MQQQQQEHANRMNEQARRQQEENARRNQGGNGQPYEPPAQFREPQNHGAVSRYNKNEDEMGYIVVQGLVSSVSASIQIDMECHKRNVQCIPELKRLVSNTWVLIGRQRYYGTDMLSISVDPSRERAKEILQQQCIKNGSRCEIKQAVAMFPHRRGVRYQRFQVVAN